MVPVSERSKAITRRRLMISLLLMRMKWCESRRSSSSQSRWQEKLVRFRRGVDMPVRRPDTDEGILLERERLVLLVADDGDGGARGQLLNQTGQFRGHFGGFDDEAGLPAGGIQADFNVHVAKGVRFEVIHAGSLPF